MSALASSVSAVIVFQRGAVVTRVAHAQPRAGEVILDGLPLCLDDESVRVELGTAAAAAGWSVSDVQVDVHAPIQDETAQPSDEVELSEATAARDRARGRLQETSASIEALRAVELRPRVGEHKDQRPTHDPTQGRLAWLALRGQTLVEMQTTLAEQRVALDQAEESLRALMDRQQVSSSDRDLRSFEPRKRVTLRVSPGEATDEVPIELSYRVPGARWAPSYTLRLGNDTRATLELRAVVAQQTGEDWSGAALTVSTASWQAWHDLPRLDALRVGRSQPPVARAGWREPPPDPEALYADHDRQMDGLELPASFGARMLAGSAAPTPKKPAPARRARPASPPAPQQSMAMAPGASGAPMPPPAAAPVFGRARKSKKAAPRSEPAPMMDAGGGEELAEIDAFMDEPPEPAIAVHEPEVGLGRSWFDYGRLRLPMPFELGRGRLQRVGVFSSVGADQARLSELVSAATERARGFSCSAPAGHSWVQAEAGHAYAYVCGTAVNIPSDAQTHVVSVLEATVQTSRAHVCVPGVSLDVFRTLAGRSTLSQPLPEGPLDVYERDVFLLTATLDAVGVGARFEVGLGVEQAIKVARNVSFSEDSEGLIKKHNTYAHRIVLDVQNLLPASALIEVRERVPVPASDEEDIEVEESNVDPPWDHYKPKDDPLQGGRRWCLQVPAGEKQTLAATWTVRVPGGSELVGGNRRDG
ncbi:MAG: DUF4139 domain-containing protein [Nannocystales bacterium]